MVMPIDVAEEIGRLSIDAPVSTRNVTGLSFTEPSTK
jgi:hypothetical protein